MRTLYLLLILVGLILVFRAYMKIKNPKKQSHTPIPKIPLSENPLYQMMKELHGTMGKEESVDGKVPGGYGEFGLTVTNPIPVNGIMGTTKYLNSLRT